MRSISKVFFLGVMVFLFSFLQALADQSNPVSISDFKGMGGVIKDDFLVNDDIGTAGQSSPAISRDPGGNFIITWTDERSGKYNIYAQRYDALGTPLDSNFKVSDPAGTGHQWLPAIAMNRFNRFVISWEDERNGSSNRDVYAQIYDSLGDPLGLNFKVNDDAGSSLQYASAVVMNHSGNFIITWSDMRDGNSDIYAQRFDLAGARIGSNFKVNDDMGTAGQYYPDISMDSSGSFVITWTDYRNAKYETYAQRYDPSGTALGPNFKVNDPTGSTDQFSFPAIAMDGTSSFIITWQTAGWDIYAQRYDFSGNPIGLNFLVNSDTAPTYQTHPDISFDSHGNFVITWGTYNYVTSHSDIHAQRYDLSGTPLAVNFKVNDDTGTAAQGDPVTTMDASGNFVIAWEDYRNGNADIYVQRYDAIGTPLNSNFKANHDIEFTAEQTCPAIAVDGFGNYFVTWRDSRNFSNGNWKVYVQRYDPTGSPIGLNFKVNDNPIFGFGFSPDIAADIYGDFVVTWNNASDRIYAQRYNSIGSPLGSNFRVDDDSGYGDAEDPRIAVDGSGNFVITWWDGRNGNVDIYAQMYNSQGIPLGANFKVNNDTGNALQLAPAVASDPAGNFVITWRDDRWGLPRIFAQMYNSSGTPVGFPNFPVNLSGIGYSTDVAMDSHGNFIVTWAGYTSGSYGIYAQRYNSTGSTVGSNFKVSHDTATISQEQPNIAIDNSGKFVITWYNDSLDVYAQRYDSSGVAIGKNYLVPNSQLTNVHQFLSAVAAANSAIYFAWVDNRRGNSDIYSKVVDWNWTKVEDEQIVGLPKLFELGQNYPNPFNPTTTITFQAGSKEQVAGSPIHTTLKIYNILGQKVRTLMDEKKAPGNYNIIWDGKDDSGKDVASGIYFYQLKTKDYTATKKMVLLR